MRMVILAVLCALPNVVRADQMRVTSYDMDDAGGIVRLESDSTVGEPWLRVEAHTVRVWFPHVVDIARFDHEREAGQPIRALALRPGANDTAVLRIELGTARHVKPGDVEITRHGAEATVQIRIPKLTPTSDGPSPGPVASDERVAANSVAETGTGKAVPPPAAEPAQPSAAAPLPTKPANDISLEKALSGSQAELSNGSSPTLLYLLIATIVLALMLGALQLFNKKKPGVKPQIEVLGARRLGHRQELLIVRALGSDHLLLCTGGRAERVASSPTPPPAALPADTQAHGEDSQAGGLNLISRLSSHHRLRKMLDSVDRDLPDEDVVEAMPLTKPNPFGAELFSAARKQSSLHALPDMRGRQSEAVAGIDRLRKRAAT
jgi:hypothetical protein